MTPSVRYPALACVLSFAGTAFAQTAPSVAELKAQVVRDVEAMHKQTQVMVDMVFSFAELGFQEFETSKYLTGILEQEGSSSIGPRISSTPPRRSRSP